MSADHDSRPTKPSAIPGTEGLEDVTDDAVIVGDEPVPATVASARTPVPGAVSDEAEPFELRNTRTAHLPPAPPGLPPRTPAVRSVTVVEAVSATPSRGADAKKRGAMKQLPGIIIVSAAGLLLSAFAAGYGLGRGVPKAVTPERVTVTVTVPVNHASREAVAARNVVWKSLNHEADGLPESPQKRLGQALSELLSPGADLDSRMDGFNKFLKKGAAYFSEEQSDAIARSMVEGTAADVAAAMKKVAIADGNASDLLRGIMADDARIKNVVAGKKVPLETMPDGSRP